MNIVITGATGYFGRHILPALANLSGDHQIMTINRDVEKAERLFPYSCCKHISVNDMQKEMQAFEPEVVLHLATLSTSRFDEEIIEPIIAANITFGVKLLSVISSIPSVKLFVNTGSFAEFRLGMDKMKDAYLYTATKSAYRHFVDFYSDLSGFKYITAVPFTVYGGKDTNKKLIDYVKESLDAETPVKMTLGEQVLDFIHIDDIVAFYSYLIEHINVASSLQNGCNIYLGTGVGTSVRALAAKVESLFDRPCNIEWGGIPYRPLDVMKAIAPIAQNPKTLQWHAQISLTEGLHRYFEI